MKIKTLVTISLILAQCFVLGQSAYANGGSGRGRGSHRSYYKSYHYYPKDLYYHHKVYYYPQRKYYYYYDLYPQKRYYYEAEREYVPANPQYLSIVSVANMAAQGVPDEVIIAEIQRTNSSYRLSSETIEYLRQNGASDELINFMLGTSRG